jgi:hypothetical protein
LGTFRAVDPTARRLAALLMLTVVLPACGGGSSPSSAASRSANPTLASTPTPTPTAFTSSHYGFTVTSTDWTGTDATVSWNGKGSPGDQDPTVDTVVGPEGEQAYAYAEATKEDLQQFAARSRAVNATVHPCPAKPQVSTTTTIGGEPAILDQEHCPAPGGPYVITAFVGHGGRAYVFFTYSIPAGTDGFTRQWFVSFLKDVSFGA